MCNIVYFENLCFTSFELGHNTEEAVTGMHGSTREPRVCFSWAHIRRRHYRMITKKHSPDWPDHRTRVQVANKNKLGRKIYGH